VPAERATTRPNIGLRLLVVATILATIAMNALANIIPFFGRGTGEVSAIYPTLITPAGFTFAIWGVIYLGLLAYAAAQFLSPLNDDPLPDRLAWPLIVSGVANVVWLLLWHSLNIGWSVAVMAVLLGSLITAYAVARADRSGRPPALERWAVRAPLAVYLGWLCIATIANISSALSDAGWSGWGVSAEGWGVIVLIVGASLALLGLWRNGDTLFAAVFVWAFYGVAEGTPSQLVRTAATVLAAVIATGILASAVLRRRLV